MWKEKDKGTEPGRKHLWENVAGYCRLATTDELRRHLPSSAYNYICRLAFICLFLNPLHFLWKGKLSISLQNFLFINQLHICPLAIKAELKQQWQKMSGLSLNLYGTKLRQLKKWESV